MADERKGLAAVSVGQVWMPTRDWDHTEPRTVLSTSPWGIRYANSRGIWFIGRLGFAAWRQAFACECRGQAV